MAQNSMTCGSALTIAVSIRSTAADRLPSASESVSSAVSSRWVTHCCRPSGQPAQKLRSRAEMWSTSAGRPDRISGSRSIRSVACRISWPTSTAPSVTTSASSASVTTAARKPRLRCIFRRPSRITGSISAAKPSASKKGSSHTSA